MSGALAQLRAGGKRAVQAVLPGALASAVLRLWRRVYWWYRKLHSQRPRRGANRRIAARLVAEATAHGCALQLELGSAKRAGMQDWIAVDLGGGGDLALDFTEPLPFPDESIERIYSSHVLEHFSYPRPMLGFLGECHRILRRGGEFSLAVPDARIYIAGYNNPDAFDAARFCSHDTGLSFDTPMDYLNFIAYMGGDHKHLFDERNLLAVLREAGFSDVALRAFDPRIDLAVRRHESIYAHARK